jgi:flagellar FliJ protein
MKRPTLQDTPSWIVLKQLAQHETEDSARRLGSLARRRHDAQKQLQMLLDYRADYQARLDSATRNGIRGEGLRNFRVFLDNLEAAIEQQSNILASLQEDVLAATAAWKKDQRRVDSYQVLDERQATAQRRTDDRVQQGLQDEMATRTYLKRRAGDD